MSSLPKLSHNFNIGGTVVSIPSIVVRAHVDSLFYKLVVNNENFHVVKDMDGNITIDRDPALIHLIMEYMKDPNHDVIATPLYSEQLREEARFYGLLDLEARMDRIIHTPAPIVPNFPRFDGVYIIVEESSKLWNYTISFESNSQCNLKTGGTEYKGKWEYKTKEWIACTWKQSNGNKTLAGELMVWRSSKSVKRGNLVMVKLQNEKQCAASQAKFYSSYKLACMLSDRFVAKTCWQ